MMVITNGDDFGISSNVNTTIQKLHRIGVLSSTTIMSGGPNFEQAIQMAKSELDMGVGVHLCLDGPYSIGSNYRTILDRSTNEFYPLREIIRRLRRALVNESEIFEEHCLQIEKTINAGIEITHLDHHHHLNLYPAVIRSMIKAAKRYNIPYLRSQIHLLNNPKYFGSQLYRRLLQQYVMRKIYVPDGFYSPLLTGGMSFVSEYNRLEKLISMDYSIVEIMMHPRSADDVETQFFSSIEVIDLLSNTNIVSFQDII